MTEHPIKGKSWRSEDNGHHWNALRLLTGLGEEKRGHRLTGINIHIKPESILIVLKKTTPKGPQVAFIESASLEDVLWVLSSLIRAKQVPWKEDKWEMRKLAKRPKDP